MNDQGRDVQQGWGVEGGGWEDREGLMIAGGWRGREGRRSKDEQCPCRLNASQVEQQAAP